MCARRLNPTIAAAYRAFEAAKPFWGRSRTRRFFSRHSGLDDIAKGLAFLGRGFSIRQCDNGIACTRDTSCRLQRSLCLWWAMTEFASSAEKVNALTPAVSLPSTAVGHRRGGHRPIDVRFCQHLEAKVPREGLCCDATTNRLASLTCLMHSILELTFERGLGWHMLARTTSGWSEAILYRPSLPTRRACASKCFAGKQ